MLLIYVRLYSYRCKKIYFESLQGRLPPHQDTKSSLLNLKGI